MTLQALGVASSISKQGDTVRLTTTEGAKTELALARIRGEYMVAMSDILPVVKAELHKASAAVGGESEVWLEARATRLIRRGDSFEITVTVPGVVSGGRLAHKPGSDCIWLRGVNETTLQDVLKGVPDVRVEHDSVGDRSGVRLIPQHGKSLVWLGNQSPVASSISFAVGDVPTPVTKDRTPAPTNTSRSVNTSGHSGEKDTSKISSLVSKSGIEPSKPKTGSSALTAHEPKPVSEPPRYSEISGLYPGVLSPDLPDPGRPSTLPSVVLASRNAVQARLVSVDFQTDLANRARLDIAITGDARPTVRYIPGGGSMEVVLKNTAIEPAAGVGDRHVVNHPYVTGFQIDVAPEMTSDALVRIDTSRILGYSLELASGHVYVDLRLPRNANGALADKLIVVDPGHGGVAAGATVREGARAYYEKTTTLEIALKLRTALENCGARVVMTRDKDVDIPLYDRPRLANTIGADLYISIHNDSTPHANSASGTTTYYHNSDPSSRALAQCVQDAVQAVTGLPGRGALTDTRLYASGLAVLRNSTMPAVLCEVAYINNNSDRARLFDPSFQSKVANAMCEGLRTYVEGQARSAAKPTTPDQVPGRVLLVQPPHLMNRP